MKSNLSVNLSSKDFHSTALCVSVVHDYTAALCRVSLEELRLSLDKSISELETRLQPMRDSGPSQRDRQPEEEGGSFAPALYHIPAITIPVSFTPLAAVQCPF